VETVVFLREGKKFINPRVGEVIIILETMERILYQWIHQTGAIFLVKKNIP
jgi:hypothetical protein